MTRHRPRPSGVLIVDDQPPFRDAARTVVSLLRGWQVVGEVGYGRRRRGRSASHRARHRADGHQPAGDQRHRSHPPDPGRASVRPSGVAVDLRRRRSAGRRARVRRRRVRPQRGPQPASAARGSRTVVGSQSRSASWAACQPPMPCTPAARRGAGRADVQARQRGRPRVRRQHRPGDELAQVGRPAAEVAADQVRVELLELRRAKWWRASTRSRNPGAKRSSCDSIASVISAGRTVRHVAVGPEACAVRPAPDSDRRRSAARTARTDGRDAGRARRRPRRRRSRRACRRHARCRPAAPAASRQGIGPASA